MTKTRGEIAEAKIKMIEIYASKPEISDAEMGELVGLNSHTVAKYREQLFELLCRIQTDIERKISEKIGEEDVIWQKITEKLK